MQLACGIDAIEKSSLHIGSREMHIVTQSDQARRKQYCNLFCAPY